MTPRGEVSRWEWATGAVGLCLVLGALGVLGRQALAPPTPPDLVVRVDSVSRVSQGYLAHVHVRNRGRATAAAVRVEGALVLPPADTSRGTLTLDYVPGLSEGRGGLLFARDPRQGRLEVRARGFAAP